MDREETKDSEEGINLINYLRILNKRKKSIFYLFLFSLISTAIISLFKTNIYRSEVTLMPIDPGKGLSSSMMSAAESFPFLSNLGARFGGSSSMKLSNILESRTLAENVTRSLNLDRIFFKKFWDNEKNKWRKNPPPSIEKVAKMLKGLVKVSLDNKKGLLTVSVMYKDPKLAAKIANEYLSALQKFINENTMTLAKKNRISLENQLKKTREDLLNTEELLATFQQKKQIVALDKQTESVIKTSGDLKGKLVAKKVELGMVRKFSTDSNPDVIKLKDEITELEKQVEMIDIGQNAGKPLKNGEKVFLPFTETANVGLNYIRLKREVITLEKVYELLSQQYELAKIEEAKDSIDFVIIDKAIPLKQKVKPKRILNVMVSGITSLFIGIFLAFILEYLENVKKGDRIKEE
ncbi:MAG: hypothetical protein A2149_00230 [Candidatus Schekmanbacteria bacterium RBG_16_38_11]|uniref:Tyrosine kinase G-rich domain-containing protein n=1 Tax=Candidatus Schekmanbacteria bacterium RBG_16_38_11 TaxID=1817880 RepID=A0A1F7RSV2_9BACT|nr:MAG: hypothetical protein A2149_00230 [Candidatus Schekmanbacteria bacterium RBG_16_38_11]